MFSCRSAHDHDPGRYLQLFFGRPIYFFLSFWYCKPEAYAIGDLSRQPLSIFYFSAMTALFFKYSSSVKPCILLNSLGSHYCSVLGLCPCGVFTVWEVPPELSGRILPGFVPETVFFRLLLITVRSHLVAARKTLFAAV